MSQSFPCLNPTCAHTFSTDEVRAAGALKCPECGSVFQLRSGTAAVQPPAAKAKTAKMAALTPAKTREQPKAAIAKEVPATPAAKPTPIAKPVAKATPANPVAAAPPVQPPLAVAAPVQAAPPIAPVMHPAPAALQVGAGGDIVSEKVRQRLEKQPWNWHRIAMFAAGGAVALSLLLVFFLILNSVDREDSGPVGRGYVGQMNNTLKRLEDIFRLTLPKDVWNYDMAIRMGLDAVVGMKRYQPDVWFAVAAKDYDMRSPRKAELLKECVARLENYFSDTLELAEKAENSVFAGKDAQRLEFRGQIKQVRWHGECHMFTDHGVGYFFFIAGPNLELAREQFATFEKGEAKFDIINKRHGWSAQPPKYVTTRGRNAPVAFRTLEGVFEQQIAADEDERGEILLLGRYSTDDSDPNANRKNASILVLALDKADDLNQAVTKAIEYLQEKKKAEDADYKVAPLEDAKQAQFGKLANVGDRRGRIIELAVNLKTEPKRYILLAVLNTNEKVIAIRCDATWEARQIWREEFIDLLQQFTMK